MFSSTFTSGYRFRKDDSIDMTMEIARDFKGVVTLSSGEQMTALLPEIRQWHPSLFSSAPWRGHDECEWREQSGCDAVRRRDFGWYETLQTCG
jgi:hypothetical protein